MEKKNPASADALFRKLNMIVALSQDFQEFIQQHLRTDRYPRGHKLLSPGEVCDRVYFIVEGEVRSFFYNQKDKECTGWFMHAGDLMVSVYSYFTQLPAAEYIEILEPATLQSISWHHMQAAYAQFSEANVLGRQVAEAYYVKSEQRAILLRSSTAEERYKLLLKEHSSINQIASQGQIASYLGITPETLSRLRSSGAI